MKMIWSAYPLPSPEVVGGAGGAVVSGGPSVVTGVGAIRLRFSRPCSSPSDALLTTLSRFTPETAAGTVVVDPLICP